MTEPTDRLLLRVGAASHIGARHHNADAFGYIEDTATGEWCWAVADGIGDRPDAADAAHRAVHAAVTAGSAKSAETAMLAAADALAADSADKPEADCVLAVAIQQGESAVEIAWTGDIRCYRYDAAGLTLLTTDHTVGQHMRSSGGPVQAAEAGKYDHIVTTTVATARRDGFSITITDAGFLGLLLVSDGVGKVLEDRMIAGMFTEYGRDPQACAEQLVAEAVRLSGEDADNATALAVIPAGGGACP
ncbi:protein phosphatase 2C domain-containing protein [Crossiella sp. SN42]|uniref:PP2C family protein-serine/threonine phosphatase n=1 Tax=Crossiella sp. SN42 TaxID=2944808 RepID=UPI00207CEF1E|nr:protein phosphatase 2C domain-containing protein [Crossiella sp. SN42]MCO1575498.1 protein phosphatase 2C domain-containing protein [Crossiella sp. SN42]